MKIDFHIHTKGSEKRTITNEDLIKVLSYNKVNLASVSDHNEFDLDKYNSLIENDKDINFIPGIEMDVAFNETQGYKQFILYCQNKEFMNSLNDLSYPVEYELLLSKIKEINDDVLISFHYLKDVKRSFLISEIEKINEVKPKNIFYMLEAPSLMRASSQHGLDFHISSYSDIEDWKTYSSHYLPNNKGAKSLKEYVSMFVSTKINHSINQKENFYYALGEKLWDKSIPLSSGLNIIFGSKGSGKTFLIDEFKKNNPSFSKISFLAFGEIKSLNSLNKNWIERNQKNKDNKKIIKHLERVAEMKKDFIPDYKESVSSDFNMKTFETNLKNYNRNSTIIKMLNALPIVDDKKIIKTTTIKNKYNLFKKINEKMFDILNIISHNDYDGSLIKKNILDLINSNIDDWIRNGLVFRQKKFIKNFKIKIQNKFNVNIKPKIGLENKSLDWANNTLENASLHNSIREIINATSDQIDIIDSKILGDKYQLKLSVYNREDENINSNNKIHDFIEPKSKDQLSFFNSIISTPFENLIVKYNFDKIKASDVFGIKIVSKFGDITNYIPSTGQLDMLLLDEYLRKPNKNIIIDEFCNSLDSHYIYLNLIDKMNEYQGKILASTHNPIISILPIIKNYIYTERENLKYKVFYSSNYLIGEMNELETGKISKKRTVREMLLNIIEGSEKALYERKEKYGKLK